MAQAMAYGVLLEDSSATVLEVAVEDPNKRFTIPYGPDERQKELEAAKPIRAQDGLGRRSGATMRLGGAVVGGRVAVRLPAVTPAQAASSGVNCMLDRDYAVAKRWAHRPFRKAA